jgi:hypothetical protein
MADKRIYNPNFIPLLINARANAALGAAGAWDAAPTEFPVCGMSEMTVHVTYDEGAVVGGSVDFQIEISPYSVAGLVPVGGTEWEPMSLYQTGAVVGGVDTQSLLQHEFVTFDPTVVTAQPIAFGPLALNGAERARVRARERGQVATPGTCQIEVTLS